MGELISIIVPVYNGEKYLEQCISSIAEQSYRDLEILLVDDGSRDDSLAICRKLAEKDSRIRVISKENGGVASARNLGYRNMTGNWFMTMDADDYMAEDAVQKLWEAAKENQADMAIGGIELFWDSRRPGEKRRMSKEWAGSLKEFTNQCLLPLFDLQLIHNQNNKLYRAAGLFYDETMSINEDVWFSVRMLTKCSRIAVIPEIVTFYRQHQEGESLVSRFYENGVDTCFVLLKAIMGLLKRGKAEPEVRNGMYNRMVFHICGFAGLSYYRSGYSRRRCLEEIRSLLRRREFTRLIFQVRPEGVKNTLAVFVLRHRWARLYHWMCLLLYRRQRREYFRRRKGTIA